MYKDDLFKGTAWYYARYRPDYDEKVFGYLKEKYGLDGKGRLLDLGCGTGRLTLPMSKYFEEVVGLDPDPDMLVEAKRLSRERGVVNVKWIKDRAENVSKELGMFHLVTMGISFHWMDQEIVLDKVYDLVEEGGGLVVIGDTAPVWKGADEEPWKSKRREVIQKYLGEHRRAGSVPYKKHKRDFKEVLTESNFKDFEIHRYKYSRVLDVDTIIGYLYSTSFAHRSLFGDKVDKFERDMKEELLKIHPDNKFIEKGEAELMMVFK